MTSIKSYTDLQQSKKLAEILPLESADMYYPNRIDIKYQGALPIEFKHGNPLLSQEIAAWSLSALLDILPADKIITMSIILEDNKKIYSVGYMDKDRMYQSEKENMVDACVAMIEKLNELNLL